MDFQEIDKIIDKYLEVNISTSSKLTPWNVRSEMVDFESGGFNEETQLTFWKPIKSTITDDNIKELEIVLNYCLPDSYKYFLKYKHFYELQIGNIYFIPMPITDWRDNILKEVLNKYKREFLFDKSFFPFARYQDWGFVCFDLNKVNPSGESPVFLWDHENSDSIQFLHLNFIEMLKEEDQNQQKILSFIE